MGMRAPLNSSLLPQSKLSRDTRHLHKLWAWWRKPASMNTVEERLKMTLLHPACHSGLHTQVNTHVWIHNYSSKTCHRRLCLDHSLANKQYKGIRLKDVHFELEPLLLPVLDHCCLSSLWPMITKNYEKNPNVASLHFALEGVPLPQPLEHWSSRALCWFPNKWLSPWESLWGGMDYMWQEDIEGVHF